MKRGPESAYLHIQYVSRLYKQTKTKNAHVCCAQCIFVIIMALRVCSVNHNFKVVSFRPVLLEGQKGRWEVEAEVSLNIVLDYFLSFDCRKKQRGKVGVQEVNKSLINVWVRPYMCRYI